MNSLPRMIVVSGIQASGKSTVARALAARFTRGVHIEADALQHMIVSGGVWPGQPGELPPEAVAQLRLRLRNMCLLGRSFFTAGFSVVMDDIIIGERWDHLCEDLAGCEFSLVVLAPSVQAVLRRDRERHQRTLGVEWAEYLDREQRRTMVGKGLWTDSSDQTVEETVEAIWQALASR